MAYPTTEPEGFMTEESCRRVNPVPGCLKAGCDREPAFWWYDRGDDRWRPVCEPHARHLHPSIELHAWLEGGYMKPVELGKPASPPPPPANERGAAFRDEIDRTLE